LSKPKPKSKNEDQLTTLTKPLKLAPKLPVPKDDEIELPNLVVCSMGSGSLLQDELIRNSENMTQPPEVPYTQTIDPMTDNYLFTIPGFSLCAALHNNARLQGISCLFPTARTSPPGTLDLPLPLHPTTLQTTRIHLPYIDCFPIPKLRDKLIIWNGLVDEEDFCADLLGTNSFVVRGMQSWDPAGWVVDRAFKEKWRVLLE
jgi:hypothetical protein